MSDVVPASYQAHKLRRLRQDIGWSTGHCAMRISTDERRVRRMENGVEIVHPSIIAFLERVREAQSRVVMPRNWDDFR